MSNIISQIRPDSSLEYSAGFSLSGVFMLRHWVNLNLAYRESAQQVIYSAENDNDKVLSASAGY